MSLFVLLRGIELAFCCFQSLVCSVRALPTGPLPHYHPIRPLALNSTSFYFDLPKPIVLWFFKPDYNTKLQLGTLRKGRLRQTLGPGIDAKGYDAMFPALFAAGLPESLTGL